jgi:peptidoglycan/xylan/chitin deacetylase (PgdA/CDA1 family)
LVRAVWLIAVVAGAVLVLMHLAPFPFVLDWVSRGVSIWRMPDHGERLVYLTFDDGPNPEATPLLLDVLRRHDARATFFVIDRHLTAETAPIVRRAAAEGHAIALHSHTRALMQMPPAALAAHLDAAAARLQALAGVTACDAFRPHGGGRSGQMMDGVKSSGRRLIGWGFLLWDWDWFRRPSARRLVPRIGRRAGPGSIIVLHDGHHKNPRADRRYTVETVDKLIPMLREKGLRFGRICAVPG